MLSESDKKTILKLIKQHCCCGNCVDCDGGTITFFAGTDDESILSVEDGELLLDGNPVA